MWEFDITMHRIEGPGSGQRFRAAAADDGSLAYVHRLEKGSRWDDDIIRARCATEIARLPAVAAAATLRRLLDVSDPPLVTGEFAPFTYFDTVWEWGDRSLYEFLQDPDDDPGVVAEAVRRNVAEALDVLHTADLIHCDVAPNNILRVDGVWKLADLDSTVRLAAPVRRHHQVDDYYVHPDLAVGVAAVADFDDFALPRIVERVRAVK
ncbi:MAG: hypothetical protein ACXWYS_00995 [Gaiellaceae bacterium]